MAQVQCPNCGGYRVATEKVDSLTQTREGTRPFKGPQDFIAGIIYLVIIAGGLLLSAAYTVAGNSKDIIETVLGLAFIWVAVSTFKRLQRVRKEGVVRFEEEVELHKIYHFYCEICGYRWTWRTDEQYPKVSLRPDLIAAGNQRLEREAAERQRLAEAAYLYELQQKKK